jgi:hypothetical protein
MQTRLMYTVMMKNLFCNRASLRNASSLLGVITEIKLNANPFGARYDAE